MGIWTSLKNLFVRRPDDTEPEQIELPDVEWVAADQNPWKVPVIDVRPVTHRMMSVTTNPEFAMNSVSYGWGDGSSFSGMQPESNRSTDTKLSYHAVVPLLDGAVFVPQVMEHKWAIFLNNRRLYFVRSWEKKVTAVGNISIDGDSAIVESIDGDFGLTDAPEDLIVRTCDFLIRTHGLGLGHPVPIPLDIEENPENAAGWCFSMFGNMADYATAAPVMVERPEIPFGTFTEFHRAVVAGESAVVASILDKGTPPDLRGPMGLEPLVLSLANSKSTEICTLLLDRGAPVDSLGGVNGSTPLMEAAVLGRAAHVELFLSHGADPNTRDSRGGNALHRAAYNGQIDVVKVLLDAGATADLEAEGQTARSFAEQEGHRDIVRLFDDHQPGGNSSD